MKINPKIVKTETRLIACLSTTTSLNNNRIAGMWSQFMPLRNKIPDRAGNEFFAIHSYEPGFKMSSFHPGLEYKSRAGIEVSSFGIFPEGIERFVLPAGVYAVFNYKGTVSAYYNTAVYFFSIWLPQSDYMEDNARPHFEIMDHRYLGPENPNSVERVYIPVKKKK